MRGPKPHYPITLTDETVAHLRARLRAHSTPQAQVLRARIILTAFELSDCSNEQIAHTLGTSDRMVRKWRRRWVETQSLEDAPRSGAPRRFPPPRRAQASALACRLPCQQGLPLARWSRVELVRCLAAQPPLAKVAVGTLGRWLAEERI